MLNDSSGLIEIKMVICWSQGSQFRNLSALTYKSCNRSKQNQHLPLLVPQLLTNILPTMCETAKVFARECGHYYDLDIRNCRDAIRDKMTCLPPLERVRYPDEDYDGKCKSCDWTISLRLYLVCLLEFYFVVAKIHFYRWISREAGQDKRFLKG